jgi:hypothetical protein
VQLYSNPKLIMHADDHRPLPSQKDAAVHVAAEILAFIDECTKEVN